MRPEDREFDLTLARECARAFYQSTGLGCAVTRADGAVLDRYGYSCADCRMCALGGLSAAQCVEAHIYGMREAERFGGRYIYFCAMGLTCFVSPIIGHSAAVAKITVGPFLMVDVEDYIAYDLQEIHKMPEARIEGLRGELARIPCVQPAAVTSLSTLLFMSAGFMNNVSAANDMMASQRSETLQSQISAYIMELKQEQIAPEYPFQREQALMQSMAQGDRERAQEILNEILGHIMFVSGGRFEWIRARCYELLVMISRVAIRSGADPAYILRLNDEYFEAIPQCRDIESLCMQLSQALRRFMESNFSPSSARHSDVVHNAVQFIQLNFASKITLEDAARHVYLSPTYLSRVFKQEAGVSFTHFLNNVRVEKSKKLLAITDMRLAEIALSCGFEDQSYYTKVFKAFTGMTPQTYRRESRR